MKSHRLNASCRTLTGQADFVYPPVRIAECRDLQKTYLSLVAQRAKLSDLEDLLTSTPEGSGPDGQRLYKNVRLYLIFAAISSLI